MEAIRPGATYGRCLRTSQDRAAGNIPRIARHVCEPPRHGRRSDLDGVEIARPCRRADYGKALRTPEARSSTKGGRRQLAGFQRPPAEGPRVVRICPARAPGRPASPPCAANLGVSNTVKVPSQVPEGFCTPGPTHDHAPPPRTAACEYQKRRQIHLCDHAGHCRNAIPTRPGRVRRS